MIQIMIYLPCHDLSDLSDLDHDPSDLDHDLYDLSALCHDLSDLSDLDNDLSDLDLSLIHISEPTRLGMISYAVFCLKKKKTN